MSAWELFDAVVVGAGPAGAVLSRTLAAGGMRVLAVEKEGPGTRRVCGGFLGPESTALFDELGMSVSFASFQKNPIRSVLISASSGAVFENLFPSGSGWAVERSEFDLWLASEALRSGAEIAERSVIAASNKTDGCWKLIVRGENGLRRVLSRWLFFANGRRNPDASNARSFFACKCIYEGAALPEDRVALHFVTKGHVGLNPMGRGLTTMCLYVEGSHLKACRGDLDEMMRRLVSMNARLGSELRSAVRVSEWETCRAQPDDRKVFSENGALRVGDALTMVHPIVGGGIPIAMASAAMLGGLVQEASKNGWNDAMVERRYAAAWNARFGKRMELASLLGRVERSAVLSHLFFSFMGSAPAFFPALMRQTRRDPQFAA